MASVAPFVVPLVFGVLFASYTSKIAGRKGRSPVTWGVVGFIFGIFGVIAAKLVSAKQPVIG
jgi:hypothetical protein